MENNPSMETLIFVLTCLLPVKHYFLGCASLLVSYYVRKDTSSKTSQTTLPPCFDEYEKHSHVLGLVSITYKPITLSGDYFLGRFGETFGLKSGLDVGL